MTPPDLEAWFDASKAATITRSDGSRSQWTDVVPASSDEDE